MMSIVRHLTLQLATGDAHDDLKLGHDSALLVIDPTSADELWPGIVTRRCTMEQRSHRRFERTVRGVFCSPTLSSIMN